MPIRLMDVIIVDMSQAVSIAIETSCRQGGVALGIGGELRREIAFDASQRHATHLVSRLSDIVAEARLKPADVGELYISIGPGSFTGVRIGVTVARIMQQMIAGLRAVAVPTASAVAFNAIEMDWQNLGVVFDAGEGHVYTAVYAKGTGSLSAPFAERVPVPAVGAPVSGSGEKRISANSAESEPVPILPVPISLVCEPVTMPAGDFLAAAPRPILLMGEGLGYHKLSGEGIELLPAGSDLHFPTARGVWHIGRAMAAAGQFTNWPRLLPIYARPIEAVRLWEQRQGVTRT